MNTGIIGGVALGGAICVLFSLLSIARGRFQFDETERATKSIDRSRDPLVFWVTTIGLLLVGLVALAIAAFFYFRR
jgi:uncharacterized membrane protein YidH (DUF202 family)